MENKQTEGLISRLFRQKAKELRIARCLLALAFLLECLEHVKTGTPCAVGMVLIAVLFVICSVYQRVLEYRAKHGLYGTCYAEAKEIILFALKESGDSGAKSPKD